MSCLDRPPAPLRHATSWLLAAALWIAPATAELGHTCVRPRPGELSAHDGAAPLTAVKEPPRPCPGCLYRVQAMGSTLAAVLLPEPAALNAPDAAPPVRAVPAPLQAPASARSPPRNRQPRPYHPMS